MITTSTRRHDLVGTGSAGPFTYQFLVKDKTYLQVWVNGALKTVDTHYTVAGVGTESGGTVTFTTGNEPAVNAEIILLGAEPYTQTSDYTDAGSFPAASHEEALDKLTRLATQILEITTRVPVLSVANHYNKSALSMGALVAGQYLRANPTEDGVECAVPTTVPSGLSVGGNYDHLTVDGSGAIAWAQQVYNFSSGWVNISRYGNDLSAAVAAIGAVTKVNLVVSTLISVLGNVTVTANIYLDFKGPGGLSIANGATVSYAASSYGVDDLKRQRFSGLGTFDGSNLTEVIPDHWGADATGTNDSLAALEAAEASLPSTGGIVKLLAGTYDLSDTWSIDRPLIIEGQGVGVTILNVTTNASLQHAIDTTKSLILRNLTLQMETPLTTNQSMKGVNLDLDSAGSSGTRLLIDNVKITGFNIGVYCDGGPTYKIDQAIYRNCWIQVSGPAADYVGSCYYMHHVVQGEMHSVYADQNNTGDHGLYCIGVKSMKYEGITVKNATRTNVHGLKLIGDALIGADAYAAWSVRDVTVENCTTALQVTTYGTESLESVELANLSAKNCSGSSSLVGLVLINVANTSIIRNVRMQTLTINNTDYSGIYFSIAAGGVISKATVQDVTAYDWSGASSSTYALVGVSSSGTLRLLTLRDIQADGNSTGRTVWGAQSIGAGCKRLAVDNIVERAITTPGSPVGNTDLDTTPSLALGNKFDITNSGATSITQFDDLVAGETYLLRFMDGNTTLVDGANLVCPGSANLTPGATDIYSVYSPNGTLAIVSSGSNN